MPSVTLVIAHRGASHREPENTLAAFRRAGFDGADGVELDVRRTADDRLVVHHDPRLTDDRIIRATAAADLPTDLPSLDEALDACDGMFVNIEIKNDESEPDFDPGDWVAHRVASLLACRPPRTRWLVSSFRYETIAVFRTIVPAARTAWLVYRPSDDAIDRAARGGHEAIHPSVRYVTAEAIAAAHAVGLAVNTWTCDDPDRMRQLIAWGIDGICTNVPDVAVAARAG